jgi:pyrimidine-nucleoside phosphorylase
MSALAMAIFFRGMSPEELAVLTDAMMRSGAQLDTASVPAPKIDKHSTGGIGDKVSLPLAPLVASCGVAVPMISGRGLGITGGTLDKLESIPGYRTQLSTGEFLDVLQKCGCSIIGQTAELAPADKKLYALRDVTGTVPSIPLISASIMSKKLAEGLDGLVLDVKWGKGAFMKTRKQARELAQTMMEIGRRMGKRMAALITDMNQPLGRTVGNALEIVETVETLQGRGPKDLLKITLELAWHMLRLAGRAADRKAALKLLRQQIRSGAALEKFREMVRLHGGSLDAIDNVSSLSTARLRAEHKAARSGYVAEVDAEVLGKACIVLGAGRRQVTDRIDHAVGLSAIIKVGEKVESGQPLAVLHANDQTRLDEAGAILKDGFAIADEPPAPRRLIAETISED